MSAWHPDPAIAAEVEADARAAEAIDVAAGYPPRPWTCDCGASHQRGHYLTIGTHRCLACGYVGPGGALREPPIPVWRFTYGDDTPAVYSEDKDATTRPDRQLG